MEEKINRRDKYSENRNEKRKIACKKK